MDFLHVSPFFVRNLHGHQVSLPGGISASAVQHAANAKGIDHRLQRRPHGNEWGIVDVNHGG